MVLFRAWQDLGASNVLGQISFGHTFGVMSRPAYVVATGHSLAARQHLQNSSDLRKFWPRNLEEASGIGGSAPPPSSPCSGAAAQDQVAGLHAHPGRVGNWSGGGWGLQRRGSS